MPFRKRTGEALLSILIGIDQLCLSVIMLPFTMAGIAPVNDPDETISGILGRRQHKAWARPFAAFVDALFLIISLGEEREHCRLAAEREAMRRCIKELT